MSHIIISEPDNEFTEAALVTVEEVEAFIADIGLTDLDEPVIESARDTATARLEDACGVAFTERERQEIAFGRNDIALLEMPRVLQVLEVDNEEVNEGPYPDGLIPLDDGKHSVLYRHGWEVTPLPIKRAVLLLTRHYLTIDPTDFDERATSKTTEMAAWSLVTPGVRGAIFPIPEVNQIVSDYAYATPVV
jgi:hypothetical protein